MKRDKKTKKIKQRMIENVRKKNFNLMLLVTFFMGVLLIFSAYAWFYASLDVQVKFVNLVVSKKNGLFISLDGIDFGSTVQISEENLIDNLKRTYPNNTSQWAKFGLYPISSTGIPHSDTSEFEMYFANNVDVDPVSEKSYISTRKSVEKGIDSSKNYIAFDLFLKNVTGSPVSDNLYIDSGTNIVVDEGGGEQVDALINSARIGFVKVGTVPRDSSITEIQNMNCNNNCEMVIYEPNATNHTELSIERAKKYGINLMDGQYFPTYAVTGQMDFFELTQFMSTQAPNENFELQITKVDTESPIFELPDGITKIRVYVWLEGQDIDSVETRSEGAAVSIAINLIKDTAGFDAFNE